MSPARPASIRRQLALLVLFASLLAMTCAAVAVVFYEATTFRPRATQQLQRQGAIVAESLRPAIDFADGDTATRHLLALFAAQPDVIAAAVYKRDQLLASQCREAVDEHWPATARPAPPVFEGNTLAVWIPVEREGHAVGFLYLVETLPPLYARLPQYGIMAGAVAVAVSIVGILLFGQVGRRLIKPLSSLADVAGRITADEGYALRAPVTSDDEIGRLAGAFNRMIEAIGRRDAALRENQDYLRRLASAAFEGIVFVERGRIIEVNEQAARMFGYVRSEVVGRSILEFISAEMRDEVRARVSVGLSGTKEIIGQRRDGTHVRVEARAQPLVYEGRPAQVLVLRDVTEQRRAELALQWSEEKFSRAFLASPVAILIERLSDDVVIDLNPAFEGLSGLTRAEIVGRPVAALGVFSDAHAIAGTRQLLGAEGAARDVDIDLRQQSGAVRACRISADYVVIASEPCVLTTIVDLTDRKRATEARLRLESQLQQMWRMEAVGRLAGGVAHDFNNMLTIILGHAEMALALPDLPAGLRNNLSEVRRAARHSSDLTRQLLTFARRQAVAPKVVDLNETISASLGILKRLVGDAIDLVWQPQPSTWAVQIDPTQVDQILTNLCVNSRDAITGRGTIVIDSSNVTFGEEFVAQHPTHLPGSFVMLAVTDTGRGICPETMNHIFEPFFTTKRIGEGTGLGLPMVFGIVKQNGGFITVESGLETGTTFRVYLPRHVGATPDVRMPIPPGLPAGAGQTVLLVEDEPAVLDLGTRMLESLGYNVLAAASSSQAQDIMATDGDRIDLLVTDVVMAGMNGFELAEFLMSRHPALRCLFVSGYTAGTLSGPPEETQRVRMLRKPFTLAELASAVRDAMTTVH